MPITKFQTPHAGELGVGDFVFGISHHTVQRGCVTGFEFVEDGIGEPVEVSLTWLSTSGTVSYTRQERFELDNVYSSERDAWQEVIKRRVEMNNREKAVTYREGLEIEKLVKVWGLPLGVKLP